MVDLSLLKGSFSVLVKTLDSKHVVKEAALTVKKKLPAVVLPYLGSISLQTRAKLRRSLKNIRNCCKWQVVFQNKTRLRNVFQF